MTERTQPVARADHVSVRDAHTSETARAAWHDARARARSLPEALPSVSLPLDAALGATLASPVHARTPLPSADTAAMDGFAVAGDAPWTVVGRVLAGDRQPGEALAAGDCLEVATGAPLPRRVRAVLPYERARREGDAVWGEVLAGQHARSRGEDCPARAHLVPPGRVATPAVLGLAASVGHDHLRVVRRPEVVVLVTGDEVLDHGSPGAGRVRDAIGPVLPGLIAAGGGMPTRTLLLRDDRETLEEALAESGGDVVLVSGGSATGPADHVRRLLADLDAEVVVDSVACRPGHPQMLARLPDGRWLLALPGNPYAALAAAMTMLVPVLAALAGRAAPPPVFGRLTHTVEGHPYDTRLIAVRYTGGAVEPVGHDGAGLLWGAALADALAVIPPGGPATHVELLELPRGCVA